MKSESENITNLCNIKRGKQKQECRINGMRGKQSGFWEVYIKD